MTEPGQSGNNPTIATTPNVQSEGKILREFHKSGRHSLATMIDNTEDGIHNAVDNPSVFISPGTELNPMKWITPHFSSSYLAIELIMAESLRRARHNKLSLSASLIQRWSKSICEHIGHRDMKCMQIWNVYFETKYQIAWSSNQYRVVQVDMLSEGRLSINFVDILNDLTKDFGDNIIFPNGRPNSPSEGQPASTKNSSRFGEPCYVAIELILWEWLKRAREKDVVISDHLLGRIANQAALSIRSVKYSYIKILDFIDNFKSKYRLERIKSGSRDKEVTFTALDEDASVIDTIITELCEHFGPDIILPNEPVSYDRPIASRKRKRASSPSITATYLDLENSLKSNSIVNSPPYIALELILHEWVKRAEYNQVPVNQYVIWRVVEQLATHINLNVSTTLKKWFKRFRTKYDINYINLSGSAFSQTSDAPKERKSMISEDIIKDLCDEYGENIILTQPGCGKPRKIIHPSVKQLVRRSHEAVLLIVEEWVKRCRHNRFIINAYNLSALVQSISSYFKCTNVSLITEWTREVNLMFLPQEMPKELCPLGHTFQLTNVYVIIKDLCQIHGKEKILPNTTGSGCFYKDDDQPRESTAPKPEDADDSILWPETKELIINDADTSEQAQETPSALTHTHNTTSTECCVEDEQTVEPEAPKPEDADDSILWPETKELIINDADTSEQAQETPSALSDMATDSEFEVYIIEDDAIDTPEILLGNVAIKGAVSSDVEIACKQNKGIRSYQDAVESLQSLEQFLLMNEDMRAVGLLNQLENMLKERIESKK